MYFSLQTVPLWEPPPVDLRAEISESSRLISCLKLVTSFCKVRMELYIEERLSSIGDYPQELLMETPIKNTAITRTDFKVKCFMVILQFAYTELLVDLNSRFWQYPGLLKCVAFPSQPEYRILEIYVR